MTEHELSLVSIVVAAGAAFLNLLLIPLAKSAARGEVEGMISMHNKDADAHPNLGHAVKLDETLNEMRNEFIRIRESIADLRVDLALKKRLDAE